MYRSLREIDVEESTKRANEDARNSLEGYLYRVRDLLETQDEGAPFVKCSKETERQTISSKLTETFDWMHSEGDAAETKTLISKRRAIEYGI